MQYTYDQDDDFSQHLIGRRIISADQCDGTLTLDDGTVLEIIPNNGGCCCGSGDYVLDHLDTFDAAITSVETTRTDDRGKWGEFETAYRIFVLADGLRTEVATITGYDGNGYYGTGYELIVCTPTPTTDTTGR